MTPTHLPGRTAIPALPEQTRIPSSATAAATALDDFNSASADEARRLLLACLHSPLWARRLTDHRPYPDAGSLLAAADEAAYDLAPDDLAAALAAETPAALPDDTYSAAHTALSAAYAAYEARFGHTFVICLAGLGPDETLDHVLEGIRSRLANDPDDERTVAADELRRLAGQRLAQSLCGARR
ncbi:2-oxo-4-hydroxy-4-carboxy-5-ureidoimidazoline decarboxylase [Streptomyces sp. H51]|uniref:2-oxo-4-hydroxy-4-carboxy-5-ureidoimidazoline decarboxylase n=1 Tax=Streptomyces sp. H51 TaxID=3111770 RepID=UPI002D798E74|nr:2-oxo-4-hydroxy-4-carboxy-5-ureidoimidazoline decarboxylase [Streptomyces sp. H51]